MEVKPARVFKTRWFSRAAKKALIKDAHLCDAIAEVMKGQADDLGGGVYKKRLNKNMHRSIVLARARTFWIYTFLFAKKDRQNIESDELDAFRDLADAYAAKSDEDFSKELAAKELMEICLEQEA